MGRPNWHYDHPPACTCVGCTQKKIKKNSKFMEIMKNISFKFRRNRKF